MRIQLLQRPTGANKHCLKTCIGSLIIIYILLWLSKPTLDKIFKCRQDGQELEQASKQTSTQVFKSDLDAEFIENWCRQRRTRSDWRALLSSCKDKTAWNASKDEQNATDANSSFISYWDINPAGEFSHFSIQSQTKSARPKKHGGDSWRVHLYGPSTIAPTIIDHSNGTYEVLFLAMEAGVYRANITLDFTLCNGLRDPPVDWFIVGNAQGKLQRYPDVERNRDYLQTPLWLGTLVEIPIPPAKDGSISQNYISNDRARRLSHTNCDVDCNFIWDGYGRWVGNTWRSQLKGTSRSKSPRNKEGTLWVYGDSVNVFFAQSLMNGKLCREIFERCNFSYNWIYPVNNVTLARKENDDFDYDNEKVLKAFRRVVHSPEMDEKSAVILNFGLHFVESINFANYKNLINGLVDVLEETETDFHSNSTRLKFRGTKIWKTTTAINKEKSSNIHLGHKRFMTQQRVMLYNTYANSRMCEAGFHVLDVFPITDSYPEGTGTHGAHGPVQNDIVHYSNLAFSPVEDLLEEFFSA